MVLLPSQLRTFQFNPWERQRYHLNLVLTRIFQGEGRDVNIIQFVVVVVSQTVWASIGPFLKGCEYL